MTGKVSEGTEAGDLAVEYARRAGDHGAEARGSYELAWSLLFGRISAQAGIARCEELLMEAGENRLATSGLLTYIASFEALEGRFDDAREHMADGRTTAQQLGLMWDVGMQATLSSYIETLAGNRVAAERDMRAARDVFEGNGDRWYLSIALADLARTICEQGRYKEALELADTFDVTPAPADMEWRIKSTDVRAVALAGCGRAEEAEAVAREAVALAEGTEFVNMHGDAALDLARILLLVGRRDEAAGHAKTALGLYERKGNVVSAGEASRFLDDLSASA
jgi:tetratricopeptide (TPR) repeat protein